MFCLLFPSQAEKFSVLDSIDISDISPPDVLPPWNTQTEVAHWKMYFYFWAINVFGTWLFFQLKTLLKFDVACSSGRCSSERTWVVLWICKCWGKKFSAVINFQFPQVPSKQGYLSLPLSWDSFSIWLMSIILSLDLSKLLEKHYLLYTMFWAKLRKSQQIKLWHSV